MRIGEEWYRTIWPTDDGAAVEIIDQTLLPHLFEIRQLTSVEDAAEAIRTMRVRGAPLIGATAAYGLALALRGNASDGSLAAASEMLAATFSRNFEDLQRIQRDIDSSIEGAVEEINRLSENMVDLNQKITQMESTGHTANEYRDQRDLVLKELSELIDIDSFEDANGGVTISVGSGQVLSDYHIGLRFSSGQINDLTV